MNENEYTEKHLWIKRSDTFAIEVSRHNKGFSFEGEGSFAWCLYVYLFEKHTFYSLVDMNESKSNLLPGRKFTDTSQEVLYNLPLHGGCTWLSREGRSIKIGCDYAHLHDDRFSFMETKEEASEIFEDATELFNWAKNYAK